MLDQGPGRGRTLVEQTFATLHEAIVTGLLTPGERLQIEELAEAFDVSPMPVREALRRLDAAGLVDNVPHRGARVTEVTIEDLREIYEARLELEPLAVRRAAERFTDEDREAAEAALARHLAAYEQGAVREAWVSHGDLHFALYRPCGSRWLMRLIRPLWESSERYRFASRPLQASLGDRQGEHEAILDACVRHAAAEAERKLRNHLACTANTISVSIGGKELFEVVP